MKSKTVILFTCIIVLLFITCISLPKTAYADQLSDNIDEQIENIDFSDLENFFANISNAENFDFLELLNNLLKGEYDLSFSNVFDYIGAVFFLNIKNLMPTFIALFIVAILFGIIKNVRTSFSSEGVTNIAVFACLLCVITLLSVHLIQLFDYAKNTIENIAKLTEIMSPIISVLMVASGGNVSASVYTPSALFFSVSIVTIFLSIVLPMVGLIIIFSLINTLSNRVKLNNFIELFSTIIKWIFGLTITVFSIFLSIQGLTSATFDGVSIKAAKYALSNSIPIVGGLLRDGFDIVVAGSVLIKNSVGVVCIIGIFYYVISPVIYIATFSLLLKIITAIIQPITDDRITSFCTSVSKGISYLNACILVVGLMFFIIVLLMIISANAFI